MELKRTRTVMVGAAILVPVGVQIALSVLAQTFRLAVLRDSLDWTVAINSLVGFVFLVAEFRWYALAIALLYFPAIYFILVYVSFLASGESL